MAVESDLTAVRWDLLASVDGWSLQPVIAWLVTRGRQSPGLGELADGVATTMVEAGAPLYRLRITMLTLHPQVNAWGGEWQRGEKAKQVDFPRTLLDTPAFIGSPVQKMLETRQPFRRRLDQSLTDADHAVLHELKGTGHTDYYAVGLSAGDDVPTGFASFGTDRPGGFDDLDIEKLQTLALFISSAAEAVNRRRIAETLLDTYISHRAGSRVLAGHIRRGDSEHIRAAFWYSDLRDFTGMNEALAPQDLIDTLNSYFSMVADSIAVHGGEVLQFIGDAVLAIFECEPEEMDTRRACEAAFDAAHDSLAKAGAVNAERAEAGLPEIRFGIGLHVGDVTFGNVGTDTRLGFNVVGPAVNLTARLQSLSKEALVPLLVSSTFAALVDRPLWPVGRYELRGVRESQQVYTAAELVEGAVSSG
jgi:adenylate cyclase